MVFERDSWQEIFATIRKNRLRTFLTMLGVFWGIFMLVIMLGSGNGLRNGILKDFAGTATNSFFTWTQQTSKAYKGMKPGRYFNYNMSDAEALKQLRGVDVVCPMNQLGGHDNSNNAVRGLKTAACVIQANYPEVARIRDVRMAQGRFLNRLDIREKRKVCVIGPRVAEMLFARGEAVIGGYIQVNGVYFRVVGLTNTTSGGDDGREQAVLINIPFTTFQNAFHYGDVVGWFAVRSKDQVPAKVLEDQAIALLKERHKIAPEDLSAIGHWNMAVEYDKLNGLFTGIEVLIWIVGIGTLLAGVIGISNIMLIVVKERTKEIGVKRALGAVPFQIIVQILLETLFLTSVSGYLGLVAGISLLEVISSAIGQSDGMFTNPTVDLSVALKALMVLVLSGGLAGFIPASKAVAIKPVEALRTE